MNVALPPEFLVLVKGRTHSSIFFIARVVFRIYHFFLQHQNKQTHTYLKLKVGFVLSLIPRTSNTIILRW